MPCHKRATGRYTSKALHRLTRSRALELSAHVVLVVPRPVGDCEWVPLRRNPGRTNATIKLMAVQVNNNDLPDHPDRIIPTRSGCQTWPKMFAWSASALGGFAAAAGLMDRDIRSRPRWRPQGDGQVRILTASTRQRRSIRLPSPSAARMRSSTTSVRARSM